MFQGAWASLTKLRVSPPPVLAALLGSSAIALTLVVWWLATLGEIPESRWISPAILPSPGEVMASFGSLLTERGLIRSIAATLRRVLMGFLLSVAVGVPVGVIAGSWRGVAAFLRPLALFGRNIPIAALIPLTILWFGIGESQKVMFIFAATVPFVFSDAVAAVSGVHARYVETAQTLGASQLQVVRRVLLPLALPDIYESLRHLFGLAFGYIMLAELINAERRLGYLLSTSQRRGLNEHILLILVVIGVLAYGIDRMLLWLQRGLFPLPVEHGMTSDPEQGAAHRTGQPVVEFENVTKTFAAGTDRAFTAIKDVNFRVANRPDHGEFISILGPSGCGKSTILRLIAGLAPHHPATTGHVRVAGGSVEGPGADRGMVFQDYTSFDHLTVEDNVAFGLECQGVSQEDRLARAREWIGKVGLRVGSDASKFPHQLSGGMRQRVAIARTLILSPRIILMDEPFGALDPSTRMDMQDLLVGLWRDLAATVFFVTHSIEEAIYLGDRVYVLSPSPGTILREIPVPPPDRPAQAMQREPGFMEQVFEIRELLDRLEKSKHEDRPEAGDG